MIHVFDLKDTVINVIVNNLLNNIHPEPTKRETLMSACNTFQENYVTHTDWSFIDKIPNNNLQELYNVL
jgi:hypothetical protein